MRTKTLGKIDENTRSILVGEVARAFGEYLGVGTKNINLIETAISFMDSAIHLRKGRNKYEEHPYIAGGIVGSFEGFPEDAKRIILEHHERSDGSGFPNGLKDSEIGILSKIVAICDEYVEIRSNNSKKDTIGILIDKKETLNLELLKKILIFLGEYKEPLVLAMMN